jgi:hypothetical protein
LTGTLNSTTNGSGGTNFTPSVRNASASPSDTTRLTPLQQGELLRIGGRFSETLPSVPLSPVQAGEALRISDTATSAEMAALQRDNFAAYVEKLRPTLAPQDRENPFAYSLGVDVPIEVKRQVYAEYLSGLNAPGAEIGSMAGANASFDESKGPNGMISINGALLGNTDPALKGQFEAFAVWGHLEEIGHWGDMRAQQIMGRPGGDSLGDEGARFAMMALPGVTAGGTPQNGFIGNYDIRLSNGTTQTVQFDTVVLKALAAEKLASGSFARENRIGNVEHFGPEGHYQTTYITAVAVGERLGMSPAAANDMANQMALGSQLPDMLRQYDAISVAKDSVFSLPPVSDFIPTYHIVINGSSARVVWSELPINLRQSEWEHLAHIYESYHGITDGISRNPSEISTESSLSRDFIIENIASGDFLTAGVAMHLYGDLYAHVTSEGNSFTGAKGHFFAGHTPDYMYSYSTFTDPQLRDTTMHYQEALSGTIAEGLGVYLGHQSNSDLIKDASLYGTEVWGEIYRNSLIEAQPAPPQFSIFPGFPEGFKDPEVVFGNNADAFITNYYSESGGEREPLPFGQTGVGGEGENGEGLYEPTDDDFRSLSIVGSDLELDR